jgi:catechol 2,3-dioxygenase-like lactoylglutathione lyase family enzyme
MEAADPIAGASRRSAFGMAMTVFHSGHAEETFFEGEICYEMLHHVSLGTSDLNKALAFYDPVMNELGLRRTLDVENAVGYGAGITVFSLNTPANGQPPTVGNGTHIAFEVENRATVDAFFRTAVANGGTSNGRPGLRPEYDVHYYAAFVHDPDGHKIEALTFAAV